MFNKEQPSYIDFRNIFAERTNRIIIWIGAGLSKQAGLPTWPELRDLLCTALREKAVSLSPHEASALAAKADIAQETADFWTSFEILKAALGETSFRDSIRGALSHADHVRIPDIYRSIWRLRPAGILSLNLDRLAVRAHSDISPGKPVDEFVGLQAGDYLHLLRHPVPFIANLHGISSQASSWVLTRADLRALLRNQGYLQFLRASLATSTVLFVGISADDAAAGGHLAELRKHDLDFGSHFWVTSRTDSETDRWAERAGIRAIRYVADESHSDLREFFADLHSYVPQDDVPPPIFPRSPRAVHAPLPPQSELLSTEDPDELRRILNAHASDLLKVHSVESYEEYERFSRAYDQAIYRAWYIGTQPPRNKLLSYTLRREISRGAFGRVFEATNGNGEPVAVKVLHQEVRENEGMLQSFRRGVRSMRILSERGVRGMVPYRDASEIPAFAVMDLVDGPDLRAAVQAKQVEDWQMILRISLELARIIRRAHSLPERVLHRDIRPSNIMLPGFYTDPDNWGVVVLDFDLSWHKDALEKSIMQGNVVSGYLAPEQIQPERRAFTRSAGVDSYGLGMTLYFLASGVEPLVGEHKHMDWKRNVETRMAARPAASWLSMPRRFARLILCATQDSQSERWDMAQIEGELARLFDAEQNSGLVSSSDLFAEEIAARVGRDYQWNEDKRSAIIELPSGVRAEIEGSEATHSVIVKLERLEQGTENRRKLGKWVTGAIDRSGAALRKAGWKVREQNTSGRSVLLGASIALEDLRVNLKRAVTGVDSALSGLNLS